MIVVAVAALAAATLAYLALMRWLIVVLPAFILVGFAFEPDLQLRFTATLLTVLAILYLPPLIIAWVWRQVAFAPPIVSGRNVSPSALEMAHQAAFDETARDRSDRQDKAAREIRDREDREAYSRDLERQGIFSLWSRQ
ncbi:MAG: hypothetical protein ACRCUE_07095 [Bosea sp. (in: a-proteobacteria)]